ncbi:MAG: hotdog fold thioesterase [Desulfotignum sp.]|nr:hotdog fold thioesterase [Desulfobacteraceae bacterium]
MMQIWKQPLDLAPFEPIIDKTIVGHMGIEFTEFGPDFIRATMPVDHRTVQPMGILHGGASVVLAETLGSVASYLALDSDHYSVGLEISANHLKQVRTGRVTGTVRAVHLGRTTHVWDITIENESNEKVCVSRLTMAVMPVANKEV